jgi:hypothetical protein
MSADISGGISVSENHPVKISIRRLNKKTDLSDRIVYSELFPILNRTVGDISSSHRDRETMAESCFMRMCT